ncbi:hypothetical protein ACIGO6_29805 [Streptomyces sp. NPDC053750]|uniref:hypothetical protein n=1 Tax=Streptomyces sp. NPDC053750 TaxID=3365714 RepID=UPI0037D58BD2
MSTEARRAPLPPHPPTPPHPAAPPHPESQPRLGGAPRFEEPAGPGGVSRADGPPRPDVAPGAGGSPRRDVLAGAAVPPRPGVPPRPAQAPAARGADAAASDRRPPATRNPDRNSEPARDREGDAGTGYGMRRAEGPSDDRTSGEQSPAEDDGRRAYPRFRLTRTHSSASATDPAPPPPRASARFPDAPPTVGREASGDSGASQADRPAAPAAHGTGAPAQPPRERTAAHVPPHRPGVPAETPSETTTRLRPIPAEQEQEQEPEHEPEQTSRTQRTAGPADAPVPAAPDPALSWSAPTAPGAGRPLVSFGAPEGYDEHARPRPLGGRLRRPQAVAAAVCLVLGLGLVTGAVTGSWLAGDSGDADARSAFTAAGDLWHSVPVDRLFPPTVQGRGAGPGGADRTWTRVAVAPDSGCEGAFDPLLAKVVDPVGCRRLLRATYTDATRSHVTTVGLLFAKADAAAMTSLAGRFEKEGLGRRDDLMPLPYAAKATVAAEFGADQRASWTVSVLTDAPVVVYAVSGWADGRTVDDPQPAEEAMEAGASSAPAQAGLGHEAQGLADRVERALRKNVGPATEHPS